MPFPTTQWGNIGNTLQAFGASNPGADVYAAIPGPSATVPGSADGPVLGNFQLLADGTCVQFLQAVASTAKSAALIISVWKNVFQVTPSTSINQLVIAVNDRSNTVLSTLFSTANYGCSWFTVKGLAFILTAASVNAQTIVASSSTTGVVYGATAGTDLQSNMVNTVTTTGAAISPVFIS